MTLKPLPEPPALPDVALKPLPKLPLADLFTLMSPPENTVVEKPKGFFFDLLRGDYMPLYLDSLENKDRYDAETVELLRRLAGGGLDKRKLTPDQVELLNKATALFASERARPVPRPVPIKQVSKPSAEKLEVFKKPEEESVAGEDPFAGTGDEIPYWWR